MVGVSIIAILKPTILLSVPSAVLLLFGASWAPARATSRPVATGCSVAEPSGVGGAAAGSVAWGAGMGGANMVPVGACDHLPNPGMWEDVTPLGHSSRPAVNGTVAAAIIVDPFDARKVWLGTGGENDEIWRSDDCGATWTQVNTGPGGVGDGKIVRWRR